MAAGCFGLRVEGGWLTVLLRVEGLVGWPKEEGDYIILCVKNVQLT